MTGRFTTFPRSEWRPPKPKPPYGDPPPGFTGSGAEWAAMWALDKLQIEYIYQYVFQGGRSEAGGQVFDFAIPDRLIVIRIQGIYFHYERGLDEISRDDLLKIAAESSGLWTVIDVDEDDVLADPLFFMKEATEYRDHSRRSMGV